MASLSTPAWIGQRPTSVQITAVMLIGTIGILIPGLQPIVLGALLSEHRITLAQLGHAASVELLCMGAAAAAGVTVLPSRHLRLACVVASLALALSNGATPIASGEGVTLLRGAAGFAGGILIAMTSSLIARSATPDRWAAIYLTVQTVAQFLVAAWMTVIAGVAGDFRILAAAGLLSALACAAIPSGFQSLSPSSDVSLPPPRGVAALVVCFLVTLFIVGTWVYLEPLALQAGLSSQVSAQAVSLSLGFQVLGGTAAAGLAGRLRWYPVFALCLLVDLALIVVLGMQPSAAVFMLAAALFGFIWLFVIPFQVLMLIEIDESRRTATLCSGASLLGGSCGPAVTSLLVRADNPRAALWLSAGCLLLSLGLASALHWTHGLGRFDQRRQAAE